MSKILIDLHSLKADNKTAIQGIKIFLARNKQSEIAVIGEIDNLLTIKDNKKIKIYEFKNYENKIDSKYNNIKDRSLALSIQLLNDANEGLDGFVTYSNKEEVSNAVKEFMYHDTPSPLIIATFANYKTHRVTCIGDLGYKINPSYEDYHNYLITMSSYMKKFLKKDKVDFKILSYLNEDKELIKSFENIEGYKGIISGDNLLKADCDIIIGNPKEFLGVISGIDHGISIYDEFIKDYAKKNVGIRLFSYPMFRSVLAAFHMEIDQKLTSGGNILLGFNKNIVIVDKDTIKQGVGVSLAVANNLEKI